jgi:hypothetical protein
MEQLELKDTSLIEVEKILTQTPSSLEDDWSEMNNQTLEATNSLREEIDVLNNELKTLSGKDKKECQEKINSYKADIAYLEAQDEQTFIEMQIEISEAAKSSIKLVHPQYSDEDIDEIILTFQLFSFENQYRETYYFISFNEILKDAIYDYKCEINHCIVKSDIYDYKNITLPGDFSSSIGKIVHMVNSFLIGEIEEVIKVDKILAYAGNNRFYSKPFEYFTGVKMPWEMKEAELLSFLKKEKERINQEEVYEARKSIKVSSSKIWETRTLAVGYLVTLKDRGEGTVTELSGDSHNFSITIEGKAFGKVELNKSELSNEILWRSDLEELIKNLKNYSDEEFKAKREYLDFLQKNVSYEYYQSGVKPIMDMYFKEFLDRGAEKAKALTEKEILSCGANDLLECKTLVKLFKEEDKKEIIKILKKSHSSNSLVCLTDGYFRIGRYTTSSKGMLIEIFDKDKEDISITWEEIYALLKARYEKESGDETNTIQTVLPIITINTNEVPVKIEQTSFIEMTGEVISKFAKNIGKKKKIIEGQMMFAL